MVGPAPSRTPGRFHLFNYVCAIWIDDASNPVVRRRLLWLVALVDFGLLGFFKYFNFFQESLVSAFTLFGSSLESHSLDIILPVGISFYTFIAFGYVADVHQRKTKATRNLATFATFVSFFPQVLAGPIERSHGLLPQLFISRKFDPAIGIDGLRQILWGLFKKVAIANTAAEYANQVFDAPAGASGSTIAVGAIFYSIQIYCDFSGYSDIALGTARLFGIELVKNFDFPYFSRDIAEFWRRWHISLNSWFRDYIYIPLGGSRGGVTTKIRNTFAIFLVSGLWHGANWTFIVWGALNAAYFLPLLLGKKHRSNMDVVAQGRLLPSIGELARMGATMFLTAIAWIVFRSANLHDAWTALSALFSPTLLSLPTISGLKGALIATRTLGDSIRNRMARPRKRLRNPKVLDQPTESVPNILLLRPGLRHFLVQRQIPAIHLFSILTMRTFLIKTTPVPSADYPRGNMHGGAAIRRPQ
jgi:alginate O-acetyltransferase complex protein AlgI